MFRPKGVDGLMIAKVALGVALFVAVFYVDRIWDFLRAQGNVFLEDGGATLGEKFVIFIAIGMFFLLIEVNQIKRHLKR